jgi:hypothetical protein
VIEEDEMAGHARITVVIDGVEATICDHAKRLGLPYNVLYQRLLRHQSGAALARPPGTRVVRRRSASDRFAERYDIDAATGCWLWRGPRYGTFMYEGRPEHAHRVSWLMHRGAIPAGIYVLHRCPAGDNPRCVNPDHLYLGTPRDNVADMDRQGRRRTVVAPAHTKARGERVHTAKLTAEQVRAMRDRRRDGATLEQLGCEFGVHHVTARKVVLGISWAHVK